jgi:hypothetical protein
VARVLRPDHVVMRDGDLQLHRIEDEIGDGRFERWLEAGVEKIEAYLAKHAAFLAYLEAATEQT